MNAGKKIVRDGLLLNVNREKQQKKRTWGKWGNTEPKKFQNQPHKDLIAGKHVHIYCIMIKMITSFVLNVKRSKIVLKVEI